MAWTSTELCITKGRHMHLSQHSVKMKKDWQWCFYEDDNVIHTTLEEIREMVLQRNLHMLPNYL